MVRTDHHLARPSPWRTGRCLRLRVVNLASEVVFFVPIEPPPRGGDNDDARHRRRKPPPHLFTGLVLGRAASGEHKAVRVRGGLASHTCEVVTIFLVDPRGRGAPFGYTLHYFAEGGIACFDLAAEQLSPRLLGGPPSTGGTRTEEHDISYCRKSHVSLAALNGHLVVVHRNDDGKSLDLWFRTESFAGEEDREASSWIRSS